MLIGPEINAALNAQIGRELYSSNLYLNIAGYFDDRALGQLSELFCKQSEEEREHALKILHYIMDTGGKVEVPAVAAPTSTFATAEEAIQAALDSELSITRNLNELMELAIAQHDHAAQDFLRWFVTEQVEEVKTMDDMLKVARMVGERNVIMVEAYLVHNTAG